MKTMKAVLGFLICLLTTAMPVSAAPADRFLVTPRVGIGPINIGMPLSEAIGQLGSPTRIEPIGTHDVETFTNYIWDEMKHRFIVQTRATKPNEVFSVWVLFDRRYETASGLHVGMTPSSIQYVLGAATEVFRLGTSTMLVYRPQGIAFLVGDTSQALEWNGIVYGIVVSHEFKVVF